MVLTSASSSQPGGRERRILKRIGALVAPMPLFPLHGCVAPPATRCRWFDVLRLSVRSSLKRRFIDRLHERWDTAGIWASVHADTRRAERFAGFGSGSLICFPWAALFGEESIRIGQDTIVGPYSSLSAGMVPGQRKLHDQILTIGDRCLIGRGSHLVAHFGIVIEDDVYTGPNVYITDQNHAWTDPEQPIGWQSGPERPVVIGAGSWLGTGVVVLPGVTIGRHVAVGAGSIVTHDLPDHCVAVGAPAKVVADQRDQPGPLASEGR